MRCRRSRSSVLAVLSLVLVVTGCSCGDDAGGASGGTDTPPPPAYGDAGGAHDFADFRRGVNPGYYGPGIDRRESAQLSAMAGVDSLRTPLPESYLAQWGAAIEVSDWAYYETLGIDHHVVFLIGPTRAHSTAPSSAADWELDHYAPKNLYEPIFLDDGTVNPENYWASYVADVAQNYGGRIDIYEVWNEPDQVGGNWQVTETWDTDPPTASELPWWNASIFAYVRALRITHAVVHTFDPDARVTVGGVGYPSFLAAVLRYTDEPDSGAITGRYPATGGAYLDALSFHYYPVFGGGSSDRGVDGFLESRQAMEDVLTAAGITGLGFVATESGAPREALGGNPGGATYSASYLIKLMTLARSAGMLGVDWFAQGDGAAVGEATDSFETMGLYYDYSAATSVGDVDVSPQGRAYAWVGTWLDDLAPDAAALAALALPGTVRGAAFAKAGGGNLYVLWARTTGDESATANFSFPTTNDVTVRTFDPNVGGSSSNATPTGGHVMLALTGVPTVIETP